MVCGFRVLHETCGVVGKLRSVVRSLSVVVGVDCSHLCLQDSRLTPVCRPSSTLLRVRIQTDRFSVEVEICTPSISLYFHTLTLIEFLLTFTFSFRVHASTPTTTQNSRAIKYPYLYIKRKKVKISFSGVLSTGS